MGRIREALAFIPVGGHDERVRVAFMLKSELGDTGRDLWDEWRDGRGDDEDASVWKSASETGLLTIGTLFHEAKANGWRDDGGYQKPTPEELEKRRQAAVDRKKREKSEIERERADTAAKAAAIFKAAADPVDNPYLASKRVSPVATLREIDAGAAAAILGYTPKSGGELLTGRLLVIPVKQGDRLSTLELIDGTGRKAALAGRGGKAGGYWATERLPDGDGDGLTLLIGEGVATVLSASAATGHPGIAALSSGNLPVVAKTMRERYPAAALVILADRVKSTGAPDPHAIEAARSVGGKLAVPDFGPDGDPDMIDFNDMAQICGVEAVGRAIANARAPAPARGEHQPGLDNEHTTAPEPLRAMLPPAEPYPVDSLGCVLRAAAMALHDSVKAPLALCCQSVLAAASLAAQAQFDVKLPWGDRKPLSLFLLTVGESGERKSAIDDLVLGAAKVQERADMERHAADSDRYEAELASWQHAVDAARKVATQGKKGATVAEVRNAVERCGGKPEAPIAPLRFVSDPTVEGLFKLLATGQPSVALFSDEGGLLIGGHALNSDNAMKTLTRWSKLWDGSPFDRVRSGDGASVLYGRRMALHQLAQPDVMATLLSDRLANGQGFLARCLVAWPESTIGTRFTDRYEWAGDLRELKRLYAVLKTLMEATPSTGKSEQELDPVELPLSKDAAALAIAAGNQFETLMAKGADLCELRDRTSKAVEQACRIAGVMAVIEGGMATRQIESEHLERALVLVQWYLAEALRIRGASAVPQSVTDAEMLSGWLDERGIREFRTDPILRKGPNQLRNKPRCMAAIRELVTNGYLAENEPGTLIDGVKARNSWKVIHVV